jgi:hypothetical protein
MANTSLDRVERLKAESQVSRIEAEALSDTFNESTGATWFWAFLFGPLYFAVHGFWGRAAIVFALNWIIIGFIVAPFLAYPAWRERARKKAEQMLLLDKVRHGA